ncbi:hypothetical protein DQ04_01291120 [Trypanosoma grayi]|uniref:hypothetical protein n=1 Tax=Trypanosoma grayi TaxID=71804 RepID=UPI0004F43A70|nr:hypothetical protein DQ04_01291120 [Trypanosoma grayi]KEG12982.1 hypothetical protein DQ04_01291120 [Trypanosoma grayi]
MSTDRRRGASKRDGRSREAVGTKARSTSPSRWPFTMTSSFNAQSTLTSHTTSLVPLRARVLSQPLGAENEWVEQGEGYVEVCGLLIVVVSLPPSALLRRCLSDGMSKNKIGNCRNGATEEYIERFGEEESDEVVHSGSSGMEPVVVEPTIVSLNEHGEIIMEDLVTEDTPFVGEGGCLVWNSLEQQLSFCLMFSSEESYAATWSALVALQNKPYPRFGFDLLKLCRPIESKEAANATTDALKRRYLERGNILFPYSYYIHNEYDPPLGFVERHALSLSIMEYGHALNPDLYHDPNTILVLLDICNDDLLEILVSEEAYTMLAKGLNVEVPDPWQIPQGLRKLDVSEAFTTIIGKALRLHHLQTDVLPISTSEEISQKVSRVCHRLQNEAISLLLEKDEVLMQAKEALLVVPPSLPPAAVRHRVSPIGSTASGSSLASDEQPRSGSTSSTVAMEQTIRAEQQVISHLRFLRSLFNLALSILEREDLLVLSAKVFHTGLLEALSLVAERYGMPLGSTALFAPSPGKSNGVSSGECVEDEEQLATRRFSHPSAVYNSANFYSSSVEQELVALLDVIIVQLCDKQDESLMNKYIRVPILNDPPKYNGLMTFLFRQLVVGCGGALSKKSLRDPMSCYNPYLAFHVLGLREDGPVAAARVVMDPDILDKRNRFHTLFIQKYLTQGVRGVIVPVPPAPPNTLQMNRTASNALMHVATAPLGGLPPGISSPLIRVLDFTIAQGSFENVELILRAIFHSKSRVLQFIEVCSDAASRNSKLVCNDVLVGNMRLLKTVLTQIVPPPSASPRRFEGANGFGADTPFGTMYVSSSLSKTLVTMICRTLTVERDTFGYIFRAWNSLGGTRKNTMFHSSVLAILELFDRFQPQMFPTEFGSSNSRDIRDYLFFKHRSIMPAMFAGRFSETMLAEVNMRLGHDELFSPNASICTASSCSSGFYASRLRYVDELEGVEGLNVNTSKSGSCHEDGATSFPKRMRTMVEQASPFTLVPPLSRLEQPPTPLPPIGSSHAAFVKENQLDIAARDPDSPPLCLSDDEDNSDSLNVNKGDDGIDGGGGGGGGGANNSPCADVNLDGRVLNAIGAPDGITVTAKAPSKASDGSTISDLSSSDSNSNSNNSGDADGVALFTRVSHPMVSAAHRRSKHRMRRWPRGDDDKRRGLRANVETVLPHLRLKKNSASEGER